MCSRFVSEESLQLQGAGSQQLNFFYNTTFDASALRERAEGDLGPPLDAAAAGSHLAFLDSGLLSPSRGQGRCGSCWAYAITGAVQYATALSYRRLGGFFNNAFMAPQLLLSCVEEPGVACGCYGGDLSKAMDFVARQGLVTFRQFPYENDSSVLTQEGQVHYICRPNEKAAGAYLGTCAPCERGQVDLEEVVPLAKGVSGETTKFVTLSSCMPCGSVGPPFYFPVDPVRCYRQDQGVDANVAALKRLLVHRGPLCATIRVNQEELRRVGAAVLLRDVRDAPVYAPASTPSSGALHSVLILGFVDPSAASGRPEDRRRAFFVCRNSWGPEWGFKLALRRIALGPDGFLRVTQDVFGGFFCCSMYEAFEQIGLVQTSLSAAAVRVKTLGDAAPREPRLTDPFVVRLDKTFLAALEAQRQGRGGMLRDGPAPGPAPGGGRPPLVALGVAAALLLAAGLLMLLWPPADLEARAWSGAR
jgi:Papain family cysteine protease